MRGKSRPLNWFWAGVLLAVLNVIIINVYVANRPIGASGAYPDLAGWLTGLSASAYLTLLGKSHWELYFLLGALIGGFLAAVFSGDFKVKLIPDLWRQVKGEGAGKRILWAFVGGVLPDFRRPPGRGVHLRPHPFRGYATGGEQPVVRRSGHWSVSGHGTFFLPEVSHA
jgi:hypothetical protein